jgi:hypothetical protein
MSNTTTKVLNTLFNPFTDDIVLPRGASDKQRMLIHVAGLISGYGTSAYMLKRIANAIREDNTERTEELSKSYGQARMPAFSPDLSTRDKVTEKKIEEAGYLKNASESVGSTIQRVTLAPKGIYDVLSRDMNPTHLALAVAAAVGGTYGGYRLASSSDAEEDKEKIDERLAKKKQMFDKLVAQEYNRLRTKSAGEILTSEVPASKKPGILGGTFNALNALYALWAVAGLSLGYAGMKDYMDDNDPSRKRQKELKAIRRRMAMAKGAPTLLQVQDLPEQAQEAAGKPVPKRKPKSVPIEAPVRRTTLAPKAVEDVPSAKAPSKDIPTDPQDPYAALLQGD